jgi:hypothetical protein
MLKLGFNRGLIGICTDKGEISAKIGYFLSMMYKNKINIKISMSLVKM